MTTDPMCAQVNRGGPWHVLERVVGYVGVFTKCGVHRISEEFFYTSARASGVTKDEIRCAAAACASAWAATDAGRL